MVEVIKMPAEFQDAINHVANYEPKGLTWMALHELGAATTSDLDKTMSERAAIDSRFGMATRFFTEASFASSEIGESQYNSRIVRYYKHERADDALPAIGTTLPWALEHDLPLKLLLSTTRANAGVKQRGPMNSIQILAGILAGNRIMDTNRPEQVTSVGRLEEMINEGLVQADEEINRFRINFPVNRGTTPKPHVKSEVTAVYQAVADAKAQRPDDTWSVDEMMTLVQARHGEMGDDWEKRVRKNILYAAYATKSPSFPDAIHKQEYVRGAYRINPEYTDAVADFVERLVHLSESTEAQRKKLGEKAIELYRDEAAVHELVARGFGSNPKKSYALA